ncbi:MAG: ANTAR domain-containing protein [Clostridium sp.]|uniref:ANTAR domain-containing response regulator n=1 Tax=Anaerotignum lactatifermentans TaxID=160404 RepID=UPI00248DEAED|nr:ANTAR domain-containing protein [Anaerotignum lactatifermentans]MBS5139687.1 ANTAR domain-containing protein [Clostridium sp.]
MSLKERVYSVLVISAKENFNASLQSLLPESKYAPVQMVSSVSLAKRVLLERSFDFVFINTPLPDDFGTRFAIEISGNKGTVILLLVRNEVYEEVCDKVTEYGILTLPKPASKQMVAHTLNFMAGIRERLRKLEKKSLSMEEKMKEIRLVNRAKWVLIDELKMSEADAHRYIEKQAMDRCVSRREIAEEIISTYL